MLRVEAEKRSITVSGLTEALLRQALNRVDECLLADWKKTQQGPIEVQAQPKEVPKSGRPSLLDKMKSPEFEARLQASMRVDEVESEKE